MVVVDDALSERQTESPAVFFGGVAGFEYSLEIALGDALAGVGDFDDGVAAAVDEAEVYRTLALHSVDGVFDDVFHHPFY